MSASRFEGRHVVAALARARFGLPPGVVERQQVGDVGIGRTLRQFGEYVQQVCVRFDAASAAAQRQAVDRRPGFCTTESLKSHDFLPVQNGLVSLSRTLCRLPDYAASPEPRTLSRADPCSGSFELSALSKVLKEGKQRIGRFVTRRHDAARIGVRECACLEPHVGMQVDLCRLRRFVTEPERDHAKVYTMLQQAHRRRVPKRVGRYGFFLERGARPTRDFDVARHKPLKGIGAKS